MAHLHEDPWDFMVVFRVQSYAGSQARGGEGCGAPKEGL